MSEQLRLTATVREKTGKNANRRLRAKGIIPAVFYSSSGQARAIQVNEAELNKLYIKAGRTSLFDLDLEGPDGKSSQPCLVWDVEYYPTKNRFQHIDFYGVDLQKELRIRVPLEFVGTAKGTKLGGRLEVYREQVYILSKPGTLPQKIMVNIADLDVGQGLRVADLPMPEGVRADYDTNYAILSVIIPGAAKDDAEDADGEA